MFLNGLAEGVGEAAGSGHRNEQTNGRYAHDGAHDDQSLTGTLETLELIEHLSHPPYLMFSCKGHVALFHGKIYSHKLLSSPQ